MLEIFSFVARPAPEFNPGMTIRASYSFLLFSLLLPLQGFGQALNWNSIDVPDVCDVWGYEFANDSTLAVLLEVCPNSRKTQLKLVELSYPAMRYLRGYEAIDFVQEDYDRELLHFGPVSGNMSIVLSEFDENTLKHRVLGYQTHPFGIIDRQPKELASQQLS